jgi:hypothetical protein
MLDGSDEQRTLIQGAFEARVARTLPLGAVAGFLVGALGGFAVAASQVGVPVITSLLGLLLGAGAGALVSLKRSPRAAPGERPARRRPAGGHAVADRKAAEPAVEEDADDDSLVPPGWYPDPGGLKSRRYWDGSTWTKHLWSPRRKTPPVIT